MNVVVDGLLTNYHRIGKGKVVLCLHGWGEASSSFATLGEYLSQNYTVIMPDLPGFGGTQAPPKAWDVTDYARFVGSFLQKLEQNKIYAVIGHSNGGAVAITALANEFVHASKLVLIASAGIRSEKNLKKTLYKAVAKTGKILTAPLPAAVKDKLRSRFYGSIGSDITIFPHLEETFRKIIGQDIREEATRIKSPTLLIYGSEDLETPPRFGTVLSQAIAGSKLEIIPGAGHFMHREQPTRISQLVEGFLKEG